MKHYTTYTHKYIVSLCDALYKSLFLVLKSYCLEFSNVRVTAMHDTNESVSDQRHRLGLSIDIEPSTLLS